MPCMRCSVCDLNMPSGRKTCPVCGDPTWYDIKGEIADDWEWKATYLLKIRGAEGYDDDLGWNMEPYAFPDLYPQEIIEGTVYRLGQLEVYHADTRRLLLNPGEVVEVFAAPGGETMLLEVLEVVRPDGKKGVNYYLLRRFSVPDYVPLEWSRGN